MISALLRSNRRPSQPRFYDNRRIFHPLPPSLVPTGLLSLRPTSSQPFFSLQQSRAASRNNLQNNLSSLNQITEIRIFLLWMTNSKIQAISRIEAVLQPTPLPHPQGFSTPHNTPPNPFLQLKRVQGLPGRRLLLFGVSQNSHCPSIIAFCWWPKEEFQNIESVVLGFSLPIELN